MSQKCKMEKERLILDGTKLAWHKERIQEWLEGKKIAPITIDGALTRACNYNCIYCYGKLQENKGKLLDRDMLYKFLDDAAEIGVKAVSLVGDGESTCSPYLYEAVIHGKKNGLDMALGTNGRLLKLDKLGDLLPHLTYLRFNISAADKRRYCEIHGCREEDFERVLENIREVTRFKKEQNLDVTIGLQMVLMPEFSDQIIPLSKLGKNLGVDYFVIKHCSDDETSSLSVDYSKYSSLENLLKKAEHESTEDYQVSVKWSKIRSGGKRNYSHCYGPAFIMQFSGSGLVAPCGMLFNEKYQKYHIGNLAEKSFKEIWQSDRYQEVLDFIASDKFDARTMCGTLCLQHKVNEVLDKLKKGEICLDDLKAEGEPPMHVNFI